MPAELGNAVILSRERCAELFAVVVDAAQSFGVRDVEAIFGAHREALTRFANNTIHQNVSEQARMLSVRVQLDGKTARASTNRVDPASIRAAVAESIALSKAASADPDLLSLAEPAPIREVNRFDRSTAETSPVERARAVAEAIRLVEGAGQTAAGIYSTGQSQTAVGNSRGLFATYRESHAEFSITMQEKPAASWAKANSADVQKFDPQRLAARASEKAHLAVDPQELPAGRYTVILEPAAVLDLVGFLFYDFAATALQDKRSCLNDRMGKPLFGKSISIYDDVYHPLQLGAPFDGEGMPRQKVQLVDRGVPKNLVYSRASAKSAGKRPTGHGFALPNEFGEAPVNLVFDGGDSSLQEMIASTDHGLLVTRLWYIREVDPYEKIMTGMTRDGLYLVEKGRAVSAVRNFRFNQSLLEMLRNVELLGPAVRATGEEAFEMVVPAMKVRDFHFSEVTKF